VKTRAALRAAAWLIGRPMFLKLAFSHKLVSLGLASGQEITPN
jgi:hypothetical protein